MNLKSKVLSVQSTAKSMGQVVPSVCVYAFTLFLQKRSKSNKRKIVTEKKYNIATLSSKILLLMRKDRTL